MNGLTVDRDIQEWDVEYKGFKGEIKHWHYRDGMPNWNSYVTIPANTPNIDKLVTNDYMRLDHWLNFHGGVTFYENTGDIKLGCDYAHLYDQDKEYTKEQVEEELQVAIDSIIAYLK